MGLCYNPLWPQAPVEATLRACPGDFGKGFEQGHLTNSTMTTIIFGVFCIVYLGMILGGLPFLQLDRTGLALLGAIALIGVEAVSPEEAAKSIHLPTLILLFSFMVVSAQMRLGGF